MAEWCCDPVKARRMLLSALAVGKSEGKRVLCYFRREEASHIVQRMNSERKKAGTKEKPSGNKQKKKE